MTTQFKIATRFADPNDPEGLRMLDQGAVSVRVQQKTTVQAVHDGKVENQEAWQDLQLKALANEEGIFTVHSGQRLIVEEGNGSG